MSLTLTGMRDVARAFDNMIKGREKQIADLRREVAKELTERMMENMPVWSGRTISSMVWSNAGTVASLQPHPHRGGFALDGYYRGDPAFGPTSTMPLGPEPRRGQAEAAVRATLEGLDYSIDKDVILTVHSVPWELVQVGQAPDRNGRNRNKAVVSTIAIAAVKAKFSQVK